MAQDAFRLTQQKGFWALASGMYPLVFSSPEIPGCYYQVGPGPKRGGTICSVRLFHQNSLLGSRVMH